jgi:hypothetical protein
MINNFFSSSSTAGLNIGLQTQSVWTQGQALTLAPILSWCMSILAIISSWMASVMAWWILIQDTRVHRRISKFSLLKNAVFWDMAPCSSYVNRHFRGIYRLHLQGRKIRKQAWACGCRLSCQSKTISYIRTGREGEWATWEINTEERRGEAPVDMLQLDPIASGLDCRACSYLHTFVDLASCTRGFLRKQMIGFHDLLRQTAST